MGGGPPYPAWEQVPHLISDVLIFKPNYFPLFVNTLASFYVEENQSHGGKILYVSISIEIIFT